MTITNEHWLDTKFWILVQKQLSSQVYIRRRVKAALGDSVFKELLVRASNVIKNLGFKQTVNLLTKPNALCKDCKFNITPNQHRCYSCTIVLGNISSSTYIRPKVDKPEVLHDLKYLGIQLKTLHINLEGKWTLAKLKNNLSPSLYAQIFYTVDRLKVVEIKKFIECVIENRICCICNKDVSYKDKFNECFSCRKGKRGRYSKQRKLTINEFKECRLDIHIEIGKHLTNFLKYSNWKEIHQHHIKDWFITTLPNLNADNIVRSLDWVRESNNLNSYVEVFRLIQTAKFCPTCNSGYLHKSSDWQVCVKCRSNPSILLPLDCAPKKYKVLNIKGKSFVCRGYEGDFIRKLLFTKRYTVYDIETDVVHKQWHIINNNIKWLPDLKIKNKVFIEVKSVWTLFYTPEVLDRNRLKNKTFPDVLWFIGNYKYNTKINWTRLPKNWWQLSEIELRKIIK